jgi:hypothetical protein
MDLTFFFKNIPVDHLEFVLKRLEFLGEDVRIDLGRHLLGRVAEQRLNDFRTLVAVVTASGDRRGRVSQVMKTQRLVKSSFDQSRLEEADVRVAVAQ